MKATKAFLLYADTYNRESCPKPTGVDLIDCKQLLSDRDWLGDSQRRTERNGAQEVKRCFGGIGSRLRELGTDCGAG
jgi:hypothetical protein